MSHSHDHAHSHVPALDLYSKKLRNAFYIGIFLNSAFVIIEAGVGWSQNSLALLSDLHLAKIIAYFNWFTSVLRD